ncbi:MAG: carboxypeptidase-like regulatory domain-containing protein [Gemmatimonadota bacterium]
MELGVSVARAAIYRAAMLRERNTTLLARWASAALLAGAIAGCDGGDADPLGSDSITDDFPRGDAFVFGVAADPSGLEGLANVEVVITPDDGLPLEQELASPVQARTLTNRRGEFSFGRIAAGSYVLFVRFHDHHLGFGEVVGRVPATTSPSEIRLAPPAVNLRFADPSDGEVLAAADTVLLRFQRFTVDELVTLSPATRPLFARVRIFSGGGGGGGEGGGGAERPREFEVALTEADLDAGQVRVPVDAAGLVGSVRMEASLGLDLVYRDPGAPAPGVREIRAAPIVAIRR